MAAALPTIPTECCPPACDDVTTVQVPGPAGTNGVSGTNGTNGQNAFTTFTANFTIPAEGASSVASVTNSDWIAINQIVYAAKSDGSVMGYFQATAIGGSTSVTLKNVEDTASGVYAPNSAPGTIITSGSKLCAAGIQGPSGLLSGAAAGGDLKGTYPNPKIGIANTKGSILVGNGTDTVAVPASTNGHMLAYDSTDAEGIKAFKALPLTADTDVADNRVPRLDRPAGTEVPSPLQASKVTITDNGAIRADGSGGNARGTDAVDLQVSRVVITQVASGANAAIGGGLNNTASAAASTVAGGQSNNASGAGAFIGSGGSNISSAISSAVVCGDSNTARSQESSVVGGRNNIAGDAGAANHRAFVGGGDANTATGQESAVCGGNTNTASGTQSGICSGDTNTASGDESIVCGGNTNQATNTRSAILGGRLNICSGQNASVLGGARATANKYCQVAHGTDVFAINGSAQASDIIWAVTTTDATANVEMFLDSGTSRATVPNNTSWIFRIMLVARTSAGLDSIYESVGVIRNNAGTTSVSAVTTTEVFDGAGLPASPVTVDADDPNDALRIRVTGIGATTIRWVATARLVEVAH